MACGTLAALFKDTLGRTVACAPLKPIGGENQKTSGRDFRTNGWTAGRGWMTGRLVLGGGTSGAQGETLLRDGRRHAFERQADATTLVAEIPPPTAQYRVVLMCGNSQAARRRSAWYGIQTVTAQACCVVIPGPRRSATRLAPLRQAALLMPQAMLYPVPVRRAWPPSVRPVPLRHPQAGKPHPQGKAMPAGTQRERLADLAGPAALAHRQVQRPPLPRRPGNAAAVIRPLPPPPHTTVDGPNAALNALRATTMRVPSEAHAIAHRIPPISEATGPDSLEPADARPVADAGQPGGPRVFPSP